MAILETPPFSTDMVQNPQAETGESYKITQPWLAWFDRLIAAIGTTGTGGVSKIIAGAGITISPPSGVGTVTISDIESPSVTSAIAGSGISVSAATGAVTFSNTGVLSIIAGAGIDISPSSGIGNVQVNVWDFETWYRINSDFQYTSGSSGAGLPGIGYKTSGTPSFLTNNANGILAFNLPATFAYIYESPGSTVNVSDFPPNAGDTTLTLSVTPWSLEIFQQISAFTATTSAWKGFVDTNWISIGQSAFTSSGTGNGVFFRAQAGGHWFAVCKTGLSETTVDCGVVTNGSYESFKIVPMSTACLFYIGGSLVANITTNIPTASIGFISFLTDTTNTVHLYFDWLRFQRPRSTHNP